MHIHGKFGLEVGSQRQRSNRNERTHIEHTERPAEVQIPSGDPILVILRVGELRDRVPLSSFNNLLLDLRNSPTIENAVASGILVNGGFSQFIFVHSSRKCSTDVSAG